MSDTPKACTCIEQINAKMESDGYAYRVDASFNIFNGRQYAIIEQSKVRNSRKLKQSRIRPSHCPFCGVKYEYVDPFAKAESGATQ